MKIFNNPSSQSKFRLALLIASICTIFLTGLTISGVFAYRYLVILPKEEKARLESRERLAKDELDLKRQAQLTELWQQTSQETEKERTQQVYKDCDNEAKEKAKENLAKMIELKEKVNAPDLAEFKAAQDTGLVIKGDYDNYYEDCLRRQGIKY